MKERNPPKFPLLFLNQVMWWSFLSCLSLLKRGIRRRRGVRGERKRYLTLGMFLLKLLLIILNLMMNLCLLLILVIMIGKITPLLILKISLVSIMKIMIAILLVLFMFRPIMI